MTKIVSNNNVPKTDNDSNTCNGLAKAAVNGVNRNFR
jgi:hypothetical protein